MVSRMGLEGVFGLGRVVVVVVAVVVGEKGDVGPEVRRRRCAIVGDRTIWDPVALVVL